MPREAVDEALPWAVRRGAWALLALTVLFVLFKFQTQSSYAVLNGLIAKELGLSLTQIGQLGATYSASYAIITLFAGGLLDRFGAAATLTTGVALVALGAFLFGMSSSVTTLVSAQMLMGVGGAFGFPGLAYVVRHWFALDRFGIVFGLSQTVASTLSALGQSAVGYLVLYLSWQEVMRYEGVLGLVILAMFAVFFLRVSDHSRREEEEFLRPLFRNIAALVRNQDIRNTVIIGSASYGVTVSIGVVWGVRLLESKGLEATAASTSNAVVWVGLAVGAPVVQLCADKFRSYRLPAAMFLILQGMALLALVGADTLPAPMLAFLMFLVGFFTGASTICYTILTRLCDIRVAGTAFGLLTCLSFLASAVLMPAPGFIMSAGALSFDSAILLYPLLTISAAILAFQLQIPSAPPTAISHDAR